MSTPSRWLSVVALLGACLSACRAADEPSAVGDGGRDASTSAGAAGTGAAASPGAATASASAVAGALGSASGPASAARAGTGADPRDDSDADTPRGLVLRIADARVDGDAAPPDAAASRPAPAVTPLDEARVEALLARIEAPVGEAAAPDAANLRSGSLPPPRTGARVVDAFPAPDAGAARPAPVVPPLEVVRYSPEGEVETAPFVSVTFSQPMVPLAALDELDALAPPVSLVPQPAGRWRWLGTTTLVFEPELRMPAATEYRVEVPQGTRSALGGELRQPLRFRFGTPAPRLLEVVPQGDAVGLQELHVLRFDQAMDTAAVLERVELRTRGLLLETRRAIRPATRDELLAVPWIREDEAQGRLDRLVGFVPVEALPKDTEVRVVVPEGQRSAEGPRVSRADQDARYRTYPALRLSDSWCGWKGSDDCAPGRTFTLRFSTPLAFASDAADELAPLVTVEPPIAGLAVSSSGGDLALRGATRGGTTYAVRVDGALRDVFGQTLGDAVVARFAVDHASPSASIPGGPVLVLDPYDAPGVDVACVNVDALSYELWSVTPDAWPAFAARGRDTIPAGPDVHKAATATIEVGGEPDVATKARLDVRAALPGRFGHAGLVTRLPDGRGRTRLDVRWVQRTALAVDVQADGDSLTAWVTSLRTGEPVSDATVSLLPDRAVSGTTDADGLCTLPIAPGRVDGQALLAALGDDSVLLPAQSWSCWRGTEAGRLPRLYVLDDRGTYEPGETVSLKGWVRVHDERTGGDLEAYAEPSSVPIAWTFTDARGAELGAGTIALDAHGGFALTTTLPDGCNLGDAHFAFDVQPAEGVGRRHAFHRVAVQEFRRPEFEVAVTRDDGTPLVGTSRVVSATARYYTGSGLPDARVTWTLRARPTHFAPPGWDGFSFGAWTPWWRESWSGFDDDSGGGAGHWTHETRTDASGGSGLRLSFDAIDPPRATSLVVEAGVTDENRQRWASSTTLLVHPSDGYVGLRMPKPFAEAGAAVPIDVVVADLDGAAVAGREVTLRLARREWRVVDGRWREVDLDEGALATSVTSADAPVTASLVPSLGGRWRLTARAVDARGRPNESTLDLWVRGAGQTVATAGPLRADELVLVPSGERFEPGESAELFVQAPFAARAGLLTIARSGVVASVPFALEDGAATLTLPLADTDVPDVVLRVDVVGTALRGEPPVPRPAFASGELTLAVEPSLRRLTVDLVPEGSELLPGDDTFVDVTVRGADGAVVPDAQVLLVVVDEAVLALSSYELADPLAVMYAARPSGTCALRLRDLVMVAEQPEAFADELGLGGDGGDLGEIIEQLGYVGRDDDAYAEAVLPPARVASATKALGVNASMDLSTEDGEDRVDEGVRPIRVRVDDSALALFRPDALTDAEGRVRVPFTLPDSVTRYRVMAVVADRVRRFGSSQGALTARRPLMVRPSAPRFLAVGDRCELPVLVQNDTDAALDVEVAASAGLLALDGPRGRAVTIPARDRVELRFAARAPAAGTAQVAFVASEAREGGASDAARVELPVRAPATAGAFATYGVLDEGAALQPVRPPPDAFADFGGLDLSIASTAVASLADAVVHVYDSPYGCAEQRASRLLALAALEDVLVAFEADGLPAPDALARQVRADLDFLASVQRDDGGFGFWTARDDDWPFVSVHVTAALLAAREAGHAPDEAVLARALGYLRGIEERVGALHPEYPAEVRQAIVAYALAVRRRAGEDVAVAAAGWAERLGADALPLEAVGWLLSACGGDRRTEGTTARLLRTVRNRAVETPSLAGFASDWREGAHLVLAGSRRTDGVVLAGLLDAAPDDGLVPKVVAGLQAHKVAGHWGSTQEDVFALTALGRYFARFEAETPDFTARAWLGDALASESTLRGRTTDVHAVRIPLRALEQAADEQGTAPLVLAKDGPGRMYYRLGLSWAPRDLRLAPRDEGFAVSRRYEAIDDPSDVVRDESDGSWRVRLGASVRVRVSVSCAWRRHHVALVDPLPAGFEAMNTALDVTGSVPRDDDALDPWWWWSRWYGHENLRDDRAEAFATTLWPGSYEYAYVCRATTPGTFVVPPPRAEEMYTPETSGRGATAIVVVE